jgi:uncharacterized membrane protein YdjX (TVP38/TMEM64 family)
MKKAKVLRLLAVLALAAAALALVRTLPGGEQLGAWLGHFRGLGSWGLVLLAALYLPAALLLLPTPALTAALGYLYGPGPAFVAASLGSTTAAALVFLFGRTLGRRWVAARVAGRPRFRALDAAVARHGFLIVLLTRLSPLPPYTWVNYAFSLTRVSFGRFVLASWLGMMPGTLLYVYLGASAKDLVELLDGKMPDAGPVGMVVTGVGLAASLAVTLLVGWLARRALAGELPEESAVASGGCEPPGAEKRTEEPGR